jgi:16S rRNA (guanine1207-N2)-methyltransferase
MSFLTDSGVFSKSGIDFGSRLLIESMELCSDAQVLDVGCGYGPIGLSAALLCPSGHVTMLDLNERAVELSKLNAIKNHITQVSIIQSNLFENVPESTFDAILSNPPIRAGKETVHQIFIQSHNYLKHGGCLWVVIQKKQGAASAKAKLETIYDQVEEVTKDKGYVIYKSIK